MSTDGLSRAGMKPQLCQLRSASASIARTTTARPPTMSALATQRCSASLTRPLPTLCPAWRWLTASCPISRQGIGSGGRPVRKARCAVWLDHARREAVIADDCSLVVNDQDAGKPAGLVRSREAGHPSVERRLAAIEAVEAVRVIEEFDA
ncbi:hypothetical protein [Mesorhizobium sp. M0663]|uniref:hypothetical protein n=1 Tax=unclassified Mesorhizobium TaxID=325217 RepID=UPI00333650E1